MNSLISMIVPIYNVEKYLPACLGSILAQTYQNFEVILVDDGSPDDSGSICDEYAAKDERIRVFHKENGGVSSARNLGLREARGEYVCFVDPDDKIMPEYLEILLQTLCRDDSDISICGYQRSYIRDNLIIKTEEKKKAPEGTFLDFSFELAELHFNTLLFSPWNKLFCMKIIQQHSLQFPIQKRLEDCVFVYRYLLHCSSISFVQNVLYDYSVFLSERKSVTQSYISEFYDGYRLVYEAGLELANVMRKRGMKEVSAFVKELERHFYISLNSDLVFNLGRSSLSYAERFSYVKRVLREPLPKVNRNYFGDRVDKIICFFVKRKSCRTLVMMGYLIPFIQKHRKNKFK